LFYSDQEKLDKAPTSFHVIQVDAKPPCLILKAVFLRGTPGKQRKEVSSWNVYECCLFCSHNTVIAIFQLT